MRIYWLFLILLSPATVAFAGDGTNDISWGFLIMWLSGGLSLFLYGMGKMSSGMKRVAGDRMRSILSNLTRNRFLGLFVGASVTMVVQSSSATTVMLVSFVQAQLLSFNQSLGVILGADIGTTVTTQLIALKFTDYALVMVTIGFFISLLGKRDHHRHVGEVILGFGILFFGMKLMSDAMGPLRDYEPFVAAIKNLENPLLAVLIGAAITALIQSSAAFTGLIIVLSQQGLLTLEAAIPLIMGANVGTCVTAGLASLSTSREAKRVALAHVIFKLGGVAIFIFWIPQFADLIRYLSPQGSAIGNADYLIGTPRQIANAHTIFNVSLALMFLPFTPLFAKVVNRILPEDPQAKGMVPVTWHLDNSSLTTPSLAIELARAEIARMAKILRRMLGAIMKPFLTNDPGQDEIYPQLTLIEGIEMREQKIDFLEERIADYLIQLTRKPLSDHEAKEVMGMIAIVSDVESIGDVIQKSIMPLIEKKRALRRDFSPRGKEELILYHEKVCKQISRLQDVFSKPTAGMADKIIRKEKKYLALESQFKSYHLDRLQGSDEGSLRTHEIHMELLDLLKRVNVYTGDIAKTIARFVDREAKS